MADRPLPQTVRGSAGGDVMQLKMPRAQSQRTVPQYMAICDMVIAYASISAYNTATDKITHSTT
ncbi:hypothetical protein B9T65_12915 [Serratia marcescens]|nr:hypothetical protein AR325_06865 [Serratia marcescens]PHI51209.1 hypothetical protein B9T65_12915 [Serratia marcescens]